MGPNVIFLGRYIMSADNMIAIIKVNNRKYYVKELTWPQVEFFMSMSKLEFIENVNPIDFRSSELNALKTASKLYKDSTPEYGIRVFSHFFTIK